jgi:hypothetical protein
MKNLTFEKTEEILSVYALSVEEMSCVKGGDQGEPILKPNPPTPVL